jgi:hypothetical protein
MSDTNGSNGDEKPRKGRKRSLPAAPEPRDQGKELGMGYRGRPVEYCREILGIELTPLQKEIFRLTEIPPYRVMVFSASAVGKSFFASLLINYRFDNFLPGKVISTAPTTRDIKDTIWGHVRRQRLKAGLGANLVGQQSAEMRGDDQEIEQNAQGYACDKQESFKGRHPKYLTIVMDEASGIEEKFWLAADTMFYPVPEHCWVAFLNPTRLDCYAYKVSKSDEWHKISMSALDHPNVTASFQGLPIPFEGAVVKEKIDAAVKEHCEPIDTVTATPNDFQWPPPDFATTVTPAAWYRPGPHFETHFLGRWPSTDAFGVWSRTAWARCCEPIAWLPQFSLVPEIGHDPAGAGRNNTATHCRWGPMSVHHERHNGWSKEQQAERLRMLCLDMTKLINPFMPSNWSKIEPEQVPVKIDADGMGADLVELRRDFNFIPVCGSGQAMRSEHYDNKRAENWFRVCQLAKDGMISVTGTPEGYTGFAFRRLPKDVLDRLEVQLLAPKWEESVQTGKIILEDKKETMKRVGGPLDDADAFILAYAGGGGSYEIAWTIQTRALLPEQKQVAETVQAPGRKNWTTPTTQQASSEPAWMPRRFMDGEEMGGEGQRRWWDFGVGRGM